MMYAMWRSCERFGILPPGVHSKHWDELNPMAQSELIAYQQIRELEIHESDMERLKVEVGSK